MSKKLLSLITLALCALSSVYGANVTVTMNTTSPTMTLVNKATGTDVAIGEPESRVYTFEAAAGEYLLTAYGTDSTTVNGTIVLSVTNEEEQAFSVLTCTAYATNKTDNVSWEVGTDYTVEVTVNTRDGAEREITIGNSITAGRKTFIAFTGDTYLASLIPSDAHKVENYMTLYKSGTLNFNVNISGPIPVGADYSVTLPADANFFLGVKFTHFTSFTQVEPKSEITEGDTKTLTYRLAQSQVYNYRTWKEGGLTQAGYFTMNTDETKRPTLTFTAADYEAFGAKTIKHDVEWNKGYETGDIFVNINERGHLRLNLGDTFEAHAMRTWELTDDATNNYFIEPDFHYTVIGLDGQPSTGIIEIDNANTTTDPWSTIKAVGEGTAIVLVTYDAIGLNYYRSGKTEKTAYMGGEYWSAIWPENTAAYVVTVGGNESSVEPNMLINVEYNEGLGKLAGQYVDAEHDVFYYLDTEEGYAYTFTPTGAENVEMAYPVIGEQTATYNGFGTEGVIKNDDGSYTLLLKEGRQIVRLTDANGYAAYQVLTAKTCHREIINLTRKDSTDFKPGDQVTIQYSGLRHPANKLAGIYNMSAYVTYNGTPNGTALIQSANQYTFGSKATAQAVTFTIPDDGSTSVEFTNGVIQVMGYGDPIGNHRNTSRLAGRAPNFTAISHKTYFGAIPDVVIPITINEQIATFEDITIDESGHMSITNEEDDERTEFTSGTYKFYTGCIHGWDYWYWFGYANQTDNTYSSLDDQWKNAVGGGYDDSDNYGVAFAAAFNGPCYAEELHNPNGAVVKGFYITNSAYAYASMTNGDSFAKKFAKGDWFKLTITGYGVDGEETGTKEFYLADLRDDDATKHYIINDWRYVDLTTLGTVKKISFELSSSDNGDYGMNTPAYFCFDNFGADGEESIPDGNVTAIESVKAVSGAAQYYNLNGIKTTQPQPGINIIRQTDGSLRKVIVKP